MKGLREVFVLAFLNVKTRRVVLAVAIGFLEPKHSHDLSPPAATHSHSQNHGHEHHHK